MRRAEGETPESSQLYYDNMQKPIPDAQTGGLLLCTFFSTGGDLTQDTDHSLPGSLDEIRAKVVYG